MTIELVDSDRPIWHTFHRAWGSCVGLPMYDKAAWKQLARAAESADATREPVAVASVLREIEALLSEQGGVYDARKQ